MPEPCYGRGGFATLRSYYTWPATMPGGLHETMELWLEAWDCCWLQGSYSIGLRPSRCATPRGAGASHKKGTPISQCLCCGDPLSDTALAHGGAALLAEGFQASLRPAFHTSSHSPSDDTTLRRLGRLSSGSRASAFALGLQVYK